MTRSDGGTDGMPSRPRRLNGDEVDAILSRERFSEEVAREAEVWQFSADEVAESQKAAAEDPEGREPARGFYLEDIRSLVKMDEMSPERYVALHAHKWLMYGPLALRYPDPEVDAHVRRVEALMRDSENLDTLRQTWLTPEEYEHVRGEIEEMKDPNYEY